MSALRCSRVLTIFRQSLWVRHASGRRQPAQACRRNDGLSIEDELATTRHTARTHKPLPTATTNAILLHRQKPKHHRGRQKHSIHWAPFPLFFSPTKVMSHILGTSPPPHLRLQHQLRIKLTAPGTMQQASHRQ